jgi:two-component system sensor histidine kinase UhpB
VILAQQDPPGPGPKKRDAAIGPIGQVKLSQLIDELVSGLQQTHRDVQILATIEELANSYEEGIDLTLYRCIQEGVTAAVREGKAKTINIDVAEQRMPGRGAGKDSRGALHLTLRCDGAGFPASEPKDLTLTTMAERVRALGGTCTIKTTAAKGTTIRIDIPLKRAPGERAMALT